MKLVATLNRFFFKEILIVFFITLSSPIFTQGIYEDERYVPETNTEVLEKIEQWQGLKFGLLMHWGTYSQWGIVESWSISPEEYGWCERTKGKNPNNYFDYKKEYENLKSTFNPVKFNPEKWAEAAEYAGMKYVIFTTKHHDGFSMFDSKFTDYKITDPGCPFSSNPRSNITKEIFNAFREKDFWTGAYFSKPDWHHPNYWDPAFPPRDRNVNYEPEANPEKWQKFIDLTHNQILELLSDYGKIDILWLDGGWVAKDNKETITSWYEQQLKNTENGYIKHRMVNQDIKMDELVEKARKKQSDLIVVDRAVHGKNQNYLTPENRVPETPLSYPWESCIISGGGWSHTKDAKYMSGRQGIQLLVDIVAKGGNLLLNVAPTPEGEWQDGAYELLNEFGDWMKINSEAIYETKPLAPFKKENICMTTKQNGTSYFMYLANKDENIIPKEIIIKGNQPAKDAIVNLLGSSKNLKWKAIDDNSFKVLIPQQLRKNPPSKYVWTIKVNHLK
jgi:alpha-L-fucosidase